MACCSIPIPALANPRPRSQGIEGNALTRKTGRPWMSMAAKSSKAHCQAKLDDSNRSSGTRATLSSLQIVRDDLLGLISGEERGQRTQKSPQKRAEIRKTIDALAALASDSVTTDESLTAAWRILWTTEKEQLFIVERAGLFGTQAGDILQIIDVVGGTLNNVITFPPTGIFLVNSTIEVVSAQRLNFKFIGASLRVGDWKIPVPPFGQGWFDSVYIDENIRVARDIRDDYSVFDRAPSVPNLT